MSVISLPGLSSSADGAWVWRWRSNPSYSTVLVTYADPSWFNVRVLTAFVPEPRTVYANFVVGESVPCTRPGSHTRVSRPSAS
ncbi:hypothetical protein ISCU110981_03855 [Isoptericola cucumis]